MCVCVCVCVCVFMHVCVCVCVYSQMWSRVFVRVMLQLSCLHSLSDRFSLVNQRSLLQDENKAVAVGEDCSC
jgi:hypothetical protein